MAGCSSFLHFRNNLWLGLRDSGNFYCELLTERNLMFLYVIGWSVSSSTRGFLRNNFCCFHFGYLRVVRILLHLWDKPDVPRHPIHARFHPQYILESLLVGGDARNDVGHHDLHSLEL